MAHPEPSVSRLSEYPNPTQRPRIEVGLRQLAMFTIRGALEDLSGAARGMAKDPVLRETVRREARSWLEDDVTTSPFSLSWCCSILDIPASRIREHGLAGGVAGITLQHPSRTARPKGLLVCKQCGRSGARKHPRQVYCDRECQMKWLEEHPVEPNLHKAVCPTCNLVFTYAWGGKPRVYCTKRCYVIHREELRVRERLERQGRTTLQDVQRQPLAETLELELVSV